MPQIKWLSALPVATLLTVAAAQFVLTRTSHLTPWKGGGFGMFSTTDDRPHRRLRIYVTAPERSEEIEIAPSIEDAADRASTHPSDGQLARVARLVAERERRQGRPAEHVRIEAWRTAFSPNTLAATWQLIREFSYDVDAPPSPAR